MNASFAENIMQHSDAPSPSANGEASQKPFASIIIPTYNSGSLLEDTLSSCLKIRGIAIEILVIDDGSSDGTPERVKLKFPTVKLHRLSRNSGSGSAARNAGLALAQGHYVKFLDHDDLIQPRGFEAECLEAIRSDADLVMARWGVAPIQDNGVFCKGKCKVLVPPQPEHLIECILQGEVTPFTAAVLYKRSYVADELWDAEVAIIDDFDWFCRMAIKGGKATTVETIAYFWRIHPNSIQGRNQKEETLYKKLIFSRAKVYFKLEQQLSRQGDLTPARKRLLARRYYTFLRCFAQHDKGHGQLLLRRLHQLDPHFAVDASLEPDPRVLWMIRRLGPSIFFAAYGAFWRLGASVKGLRAPRHVARALRKSAEPAPDRE